VTDWANLSVTSGTGFLANRGWQGKAVNKLMVFVSVQSTGHTTDLPKVTR